MSYESAKKLIGKVLDRVWLVEAPGTKARILVASTTNLLERFAREVGIPISFAGGSDRYSGTPTLRVWKQTLYDAIQGGAELISQKDFDHIFCDQWGCGISINGKYYSPKERPGMNECPIDQLKEEVQKMDNLTPVDQKLVHRFQLRPALRKVLSDRAREEVAKYLMPFREGSASAKMFQILFGRKRKKADIGNETKKVAFLAGVTSGTVDRAKSGRRYYTKNGVTIYYDMEVTASVGLLYAIGILENRSILKKYEDMLLPTHKKSSSGDGPTYKNEPEYQDYLRFKEMIAREAANKQ